MTDNIESLLRTLIAVTARQTYPPQELANIVVSGSSGEKQLKAYNLCDGTRTQGEVATAVDLDPGNFSRTVGRWVGAGVLVRLDEGRDAKLLHLYPLPEGSRS